MKTILAAIAVWLLASSLAIAQDTRVAVSVNHRGNDQVRFLRPFPMIVLIYAVEEYI